jgi:hypothetical protein
MSEAGSFVLDSEVRGILNTNTLYGSSETITASGVANLNGLSATITSEIEVVVLAQASLGGITAEADTTPTILPLFDATLGSLNATVTAVVTKLATATATLGQLTGSVQATPEVEITATANLGSLIATAQTSQPAPPEPQHYGSNGYVPIKKKQKKERPTPVIVVEITDVPELPPLIKSHFASGSTDLFGLSAQAGNRIDFSILADEAEILSLL